MTKEQDALKLSLEALEPFSTPHWAGTGVDKANAAMTAIKESLAQPTQRPWVGLTAEDKDEIIRVTMHDDFGDILMLVEAKLKEKNT